MSDTNGQHDAHAPAEPVDRAAELRAIRIGLAAIGTVRTDEVDGHWDAWLERPLEGVHLYVASGETEEAAVAGLWDEHRDTIAWRHRNILLRDAHREIEVRFRRESEARETAKGEAR